MIVFGSNYNIFVCVAYVIKEIVSFRGLGQLIKITVYKYLLSLWVLKMFGDIPDAPQKIKYAIGW